jgi:hypothetical protein
MTAAGRFSISSQVPWTAKRTWSKRTHMPQIEREDRQARQCA